MQGLKIHRGLRVLAACVAAAVAPFAMAQALPAAAPESVGMSAERLAKITPAMNREIAEKKLPGAVVMVARKGKRV
jgi:CubicO group peptidase (beta-lactamase class C family)